MLDRQEKCEVTGFETRTREECEEVTEIDCKPITVKKIRTEIRPKCETMLNKTCDVIYNSEPKEQCKPTTSKRYIFIISMSYDNGLQVGLNTTLTDH